MQPKTTSSRRSFDRNYAAAATVVSASSAPFVRACVRDMCATAAASSSMHASEICAPPPPAFYKQASFPSGHKSAELFGDRLFASFSRSSADKSDQTRPPICHADRKMAL